MNAPPLVLELEGGNTRARVLSTCQYGDLPLKSTAAGEKLFSDRLVTGNDRCRPRVARAS